MRAPALVGIVVALHISAIGAFIFIQGCESVRDRSQSTVVPPPSPVMPPTVIPSGQSERPILQPPTTVKPPAAQAVEGATHKVVKGETLSHIASSYGVSTAELAEYNSLADANRLRIGQKLIIPPYATKAPAVRSAPAVTTPPVTTQAVLDRTSATVHVVESGDTLTRIARKYGVKISDLRGANKLQGDMIRIGQKLTVPAASAAAPAGTSPLVVNPDEVEIPEIDLSAVEVGEGVGMDVAPPEVQDDGALEYIVVDGDTLEEISKLFIVSKQDLLAYNPIEEGQALEAGTIIKIPPSALPDR